MIYKVFTVRNLHFIALVTPGDKIVLERTVGGELYRTTDRDQAQRIATQMNLERSELSELN